MRLEVLVDQEEPLIFPLNKDKITIGSGEHCDILLTAEGVSRKHVTIICHYDEFYIVDQGSTNGTFINEERLVPGRRVEFTSFFPVRLGANTLLTLLGDEEAEDYELSSFHSGDPAVLETDKTTTITFPSQLKEKSSLSLATHKSRASVRARNSMKSKTVKALEKNKKPKKNKQEKNLNIVVFFSIALAIWAIYQHLSTDPVVIENVAEVTKVGAIEIAEEPMVKVINKVPAGFLKSVEEARRLQMDFKCVSNLEKQLCTSLGLSAPYGVTQSGRDVFIFVPVKFEGEYYSKLKETLRITQEEEFPIEIYRAHVLMNYHFELPEEYSDFRLHVYFLENEKDLLGGMSFYPPAYLAFKEESPKTLTNDLLLGGVQILEFTNKYFTFHNFMPPAEVKEAGNE